MRALSLDHITVVDTTPWQLAETAAAVGCSGICLFLHSMPVLPDMPEFTVVGDSIARRRTRDAMRASGTSLDLVYPFTVGGRTVIADFAPALESAAWLGGRLANVLCYDRDPHRRIDRLAEMAALARGFGIGLAIEFYPPSQVRSLAQALQVSDQLVADDIGITLDLLHLVRAGEMPQTLSRLRDPRIRIAQISDGPATVANDRIEWEAGTQRVLPGQGVFDLAGFVDGLAADVPVSVEVPQENALRAGRGILDRAMMAVSAARTSFASKA